MSEDPIDPVTANPAPASGNDDPNPAPTGGDPATLLNNDPDDKSGTPADWPEDWRSKLAGDDEKHGKRLERFKSPNDVWNSFLNAEKKIETAGKKPVLPDNPTDDDIAAYRKEIGVPDEPSGYNDALPEGMVIGEDDKDLANSFAEFLHGKNLTPDAYAAGMEWYQSVQNETQAALIESDQQAQKDGEDVLRGEWGGEYRGNINTIMSFLSSIPGAESVAEGEEDNSLRTRILNARLSDGRPLGTDPDALKWLLSMADAQNPAGFIAPSSGGSQIQGVEEEIASIEKVMREDRPTYDRDTKMQERLRVLYDAQEKLSSAA